MTSDSRVPSIVGAVDDQNGSSTDSGLGNGPGKSITPREAEADQMWLKNEQAAENDPWNALTSAKPLVAKIAIFLPFKSIGFSFVSHFQTIGSNEHLPRISRSTRHGITLATRASTAGPIAPLP